MALVIAGGAGAAAHRLRRPAGADAGQQPPAGRGLLPRRWASRTTWRCCSASTSWTRSARTRCARAADGPSSGSPTRPAERCSRAGHHPRRGHLLRGAGARARRQPPAAGRGPGRTGGRGRARRPPAGARHGRGGPQDRPRPRLLHRHRRRRPTWWASSSWARSAPAAATTPSPREGKRTVPRRRPVHRRDPDLVPLLGQGLAEGVPVACRPACWWRVDAEDSRGCGAGRRRASCARRGIPTEVAPKADKFGKQIRYADRRGIPFVWFTDDDGKHQVKDIRSGEQVAADPADLDAGRGGPARRGSLKAQAAAFRAPRPPPQNDKPPGHARPPARPPCRAPRRRQGHGQEQAAKEAQRVEPAGACRGAPAA